MIDIRNMDNLLDDMKKDGAFDDEISRISVDNYFRGQADAIESIRRNLEDLLNCLQRAKSKFVEIIDYAESLSVKENETEH